MEEVVEPEVCVACRRSVAAVLEVELAVSSGCRQGHHWVLGTG